MIAVGISTRRSRVRSGSEREARATSNRILFLRAPRAKKGGAESAPLPSRRRQSVSSRRGDAPRRALDLARGQAAGADLHLHDLSAGVEHTRDLEIGLPGAARRVVRMRAI